MKILCLHEKLQEGLNTVEHAVGKNLTLPVLQHVLLKTEKGRLRLSTTNLEIAVHTTVAGKVEKEGSVTVPARAFIGFVNTSPKEKISLEVKNRHLIVRAGRYRAEFKGADPKDFPLIPKVEEEFSVHLDGKKLTKALQSLVGLTASSDARPELAGVSLAFSEGRIWLAATDSFRLGEHILGCKKVTTKERREYILPARTAAELSRLIGSYDDDVEFVAGGNQIAARIGDRELISRLIEGKYPNYRTIIPSTSSTSMVFDCEELVQAIRTAGVLTGKMQDVKLLLQPDKKLLAIESRDSEVGEEHAELTGDGEGKELTMSLNYRYLLDAVNGVEAEKVSLQCNKETDPVLVRGVGEPNVLYLVMPLRSF